MIMDPEQSLVSIGCGICGDLFKIPRKVTEIAGSPTKGFGVTAERVTEAIPKKFLRRKRVDMDSVMEQFVKRTNEPVIFHRGWKCYADNIDMCPRCAILLLIASLENELEIYADVKVSTDKLAEEIVPKSLSDLTAKFED